MTYLTTAERVMRRMDEALAAAVDYAVEFNADATDLDVLEYVEYAVGFSLNRAERREVLGEYDRAARAALA